MARQDRNKVKDPNKATFHAILTHSIFSQHDPFKIQENFEKIITKDQNLIGCDIIVNKPNLYKIFLLKLKFVPNYE